MSDSGSSYAKVKAILNYLSCAQLVIGIVSYMLILVVCSRQKLRKTPTFIFIWFLAFSSFLQTLIISPVSFLDQILKLELEINSWMWCRVSTILKLSTFQWNSWLLAGITLEIYLSVRIRTFRQKYSTRGNTIFVCLLFGIAFTLLNCAVLGLTDPRLSHPNTTVLERMMICEAPFPIKEYYAQLSLVNFYLYKILAFFLISLEIKLEFLFSF